MCLLRDSSQAQGWKVKLDNLPPCESSFRLFFSQLSLVGGCMFMVGHLFQNYDTIYVRLFPTYTCNHSCYTIYVRFFVTYTCVLSCFVGFFIPKYMTIFLETRIYYKQACGIWGHRKSSYKRHRIIPSAKKPFMYDGAEK